MVIMLLFMGYSFTLSELQKEGKNTGFNYKNKSQMYLWRYASKRHHNPLILQTFTYI